MQGRRLTAHDERTFDMPTEPGDYVGPVGDPPRVYFLLPNARDADIPPHERAIHSVTSPPHEFHENEDGTLSITASILSKRPDGSDGWHGYLTNGIWKTVGG